MEEKCSPALFLAHSPRKRNGPQVCAYGLDRRLGSCLGLARLFILGAVGHSCFAQVGILHLGPSPVGPVQVSPTQVSPMQADLVRVAPTTFSG